LGAIEVVPADNKKLLDEFVELPYRLYRNHPYWAPPLRMEVKKLLDRGKHPYYANADAEFFLAKRDGRTIGRVAAIVDRNHNKFQGEEAGFFGFFEAENDAEAAGALLARAREWVFAKGAKFLRGPMSPSTNYECGMLVDGFDSVPMIMMTYNPRYYPELMEGAGLRKSKDLYAYVQGTDALEMERIGRVADRALARHGVRVRPIDVKNFDADVERVWEVYNSAWEKNWGFIPMTREEFELQGKDMKQILKPGLVLIGEKDGRTIGFALALPDINQALIHTNGNLFPTGLVKILYYQRLIKNVRVLALGVVEEYRATGVAAGFYVTLWRNAKRLGYETSEMSWILEDNVLMNRSLIAMGAKRYKTYRIYEWN
jgi:GNAT superfamily N-acetyltransferase